MGRVSQISGDCIVDSLQLKYFNHTLKKEITKHTSHGINNWKDDIYMFMNYFLELISWYIENCPGNMATINISELCNSACVGSIDHDEISIDCDHACVIAIPQDI